ncbi:AzlD domain-containing protein [Paenibacillus provencensis]|uniref:AzlD domain-containing protein n=1 Tax=Paenibacillus provencensis TaxID=441151 RepID=A0ABW3Q1Y2_9BACL|nr:AzlD domain-containing protein [Paenibacillus sp. MER 78]MCM3129045.1 AzlD domain-containing protein [Paenibacillus sp. MER 78]
MNTSMTMIWLFAGCALVTLLPRIIPFIFVRSVRMPDVVLKWLSYIPICILSALVIESMISEMGDQIAIDWSTFIALIPTLAVAVWTKSLSATVIVGVVCMAVIRLFM